MNYWCFTVTQRKLDSHVVAAEEILKQRLVDEFWGLGERTPNRRHLQKGDQVVFYLGLPTMAFAASATLASDSFALTKEQKGIYARDSRIYEADYGVLLENTRLWDVPHPVKDLVESLEFIENKAFWFSYFQGGARQLSEDDFGVIVENHKAVAVGKPVDAIISQSQFALEAHLEEFIDRNWNHIDFGAQLAKYEVDEQTGRQFPAGAWSIDFLCHDTVNGDMVVVELKRGKSSDSAVGQVLRYMGWVVENLASSGQNVRGIIIAQEVDDALRYAVKGLSNVAVLTYKVDFKLSQFRS